MRKYVTLNVTKSYAPDMWSQMATASMTVIDVEKKPVDSGLLDLHGRKLFRVEENPIGFHDFKADR